MILSCPRIIRFFRFIVELAEYYTKRMEAEHVLKKTD